MQKSGKGNKNIKFIQKQQKTEQVNTRTRAQSLKVNQPVVQTQKQVKQQQQAEKRIGSKQTQNLNKVQEKAKSKKNTKIGQQIIKNSTQQSKTKNQEHIKIEEDHDNKIEDDVEEDIESCESVGKFQKQQQQSSQKSSQQQKKSPHKMTPTQKDFQKQIHTKTRQQVKILQKPPSRNRSNENVTKQNNNTNSQNSKKAQKIIEKQEFDSQQSSPTQLAGVNNNNKQNSQKKKKNSQALQEIEQKNDNNNIKNNKNNESNFLQSQPNYTNSPFSAQKLSLGNFLSQQRNSQGGGQQRFIRKLNFDFSDSSDDQDETTTNNNSNNAQKKQKKISTMVFFKAANENNENENEQNLNHNKKEPKLKIVASSTDDKYPSLFNPEIIKQDSTRKYLQLFRRKSRCMTLEPLNSISIGPDNKLNNLLNSKGIQEGGQQILEIEKNYLPPNVVKKKITCNCKKTKCLKLYCDCFAQGEFCKDCNCQDCHNKEENQTEREEAMQQLEQRNPTAFKPKVQVKEDEEESEQLVNNKGCNCKKSGCQKKYCECYNTGVKCSDLCKCKQCKNRDPNYLLQKNNDSNTINIKEENKMDEENQMESEHNNSNNHNNFHQPINFSTINNFADMYNFQNTSGLNKQSQNSFNNIKTEDMNSQNKNKVFTLSQFNMFNSQDNTDNNNIYPMQMFNSFMNYDQPMQFQQSQDNNNNNNNNNKSTKSSKKKNNNKSNFSQESNKMFEMDSFNLNENSNKSQNSRGFRNLKSVKNSQMTIKNSKFTFEKQEE